MITFIGKIYKRLLDMKRRRYFDKLIARGLTIGNDVEFVDSVFLDPSHCFLISIGNNCTICPNVRFIAHDASTKKSLGYTKIGRIDVADNCFIGDSVMLLPNVKIGPNSIIGAGSIVTKDVPPGMIAVGNPARVISTVEKYLEKIKEISRCKTVFNADYYIERLDAAKRKEVIDSIDDTIGFIV